MKNNKKRTRKKRVNREMIMLKTKTKTKQKPQQTIINILRAIRWKQKNSENVFKKLLEIHAEYKKFNRNNRK